MRDLFKDYVLQRDELLARIAHMLELDQTRLGRMEQAYNAVYDVLKGDEEFFNGVEIELFAQGSTRIGTPVKPINGDDFDLDVVLHIKQLYTGHNPVEVYDALVKALERNGYYKSILEKKTRCVRLNYKGDFHMDILPACMISLADTYNLAIPEKKMLSWSAGNPKGFAEWFMKIANSAKRSMLMRFSEELLLEAKIEQEPLPNQDIYQKTPLQRAVQLIKRYRDIYFTGSDYCVSSIVLTTLMGRFYSEQDTIYDTIDGTIRAIREQQLLSINTGRRFRILNPVNEQEDFTDSWTDQHYRSFFAFIEDFYLKWQELKLNFDKSHKAYIELFGEGIYTGSLQEQIKVLSKFSDDKLSKANGIILSGAAMTDSKGNINQYSGQKNESHHNFGE